eukprot:m.16144 g.16144  ORF g.16144 m.16144 type:complete len:360 (+) comp3109_c0_seq2:88-1167(+)
MSALCARSCSFDSPLDTTISLLFPEDHHHMASSNPAEYYFGPALAWAASMDNIFSAEKLVVPESHHASNDMLFPSELTPSDPTACTLESSSILSESDCDFQDLFSSPPLLYHSLVHNTPLRTNDEGTTPLVHAPLVSAVSRLQSIKRRSSDAFKNALAHAANISPKAAATPRARVIDLSSGQVAIEQQIKPMIMTHPAPSLPVTTVHPTTALYTCPMPTAPVLALTPAMLNAALQPANPESQDSEYTDDLSSVRKCRVVKTKSLREEESEEIWEDDGADMDYMPSKNKPGKIGSSYRRARITREPRRNEFATKAEYTKAWTNWRNIRDRNNVAVKLSRENRKRKQREAQLARMNKKAKK